MVYLLQHIHYESPGLIIDWLDHHRLNYRVVRLDRGEALPQTADVDSLIVLGGPMNVYEKNQHPFLANEKMLIQDAVDADKKVLGICLGAQLIAHAMGARVGRNPASEIGWFPVEVLQKKLPDRFRGVFPDTFTTFHWHGDTFELPGGAVGFAQSEGCVHQGFVLGENVVGLQFHLEMTRNTIGDMLQNCAGDLLSESVFVQTGNEMLQRVHQIRTNQEILDRLLQAFLFQKHERTH